jgi:hypothetical protein
LRFSQFQEAELRELETKVIMLLSHLVEGRCGERIQALALECDNYLLENCQFLE